MQAFLEDSLSIFTRTIYLICTRDAYASFAYANRVPNSSSYARTVWVLPEGIYENLQISMCIVYPNLREPKQVLAGTFARNSRRTRFSPNLDPCANYILCIHAYAEFRRYFHALDTKVHFSFPMDDKTKWWTPRSNIYKVRFLTMCFNGSLN